MFTKTCLLLFKMFITFLYNFTSLKKKVFFLTIIKQLIETVDKKIKIIKIIRLCNTLFYLFFSYFK